MGPCVTAGQDGIRFRRYRRDPGLSPLAANTIPSRLHSEPSTLPPWTESGIEIAVEARTAMASEPAGSAASRRGHRSNPACCGLLPAGLSTSPDLAVTDERTSPAQILRRRRSGGSARQSPGGSVAPGDSGEGGSHSGRRWQPCTQV